MEESGNPTHDKLTFPCVLDPKHWPSWLGSQLRNVPPHWLRAIEQAQPFTAPKPRRHPMYVLHRLDIATKHRLLVPMEPSTFELHVTHNTNRAVRQDDRPIHRPPPMGGRLTDGVELGRMRFLTKAADLQVTGIEAVNVAWGGWGPRLDELDFTGDEELPDMIAFVGTQIDTFAGAFRRPRTSLLLP